MSTSPFCSRLTLFLCNVSHTGTDVMLLNDFSTDGSSHPQQHGNPSGKRRSSVTFEDQVEQAKGIISINRLEGKGNSILTGGFEKLLVVNKGPHTKQHWSDSIGGFLLSRKHCHVLGSSPRRGAQVAGHLRLLSGEGNRERR